MTTSLSAQVSRVADVAAGMTGEAARLVRGLRWLSLGRSARVAWGRCQGSAAQPYTVVVSAERPTIATCTCPSRQRPCKHARGLAELVADGQLAVIEEPEWVARIADRRPFTEKPAAEAGVTAAQFPDEIARLTRSQWLHGNRLAGGYGTVPITA